MTEPVRRPFGLALAFSLLLHVAVLTSPGWALPDLDDDLAPARLDARLVPTNTARPPAPRQAKTAPPQPAVPVAEKQAEPAALPPPPAPAPVPDPEPPPVPVAEPPPVAVAPALTFAAVWPRSGRLAFKVLRGDGFWVGQAEHSWRHDGERYQLRAVTETVGLASLFHSAKVMQESSGIFLAGAMQPLEFRVVRDGKLRDAARIDLAQNVVILGHGQPTPFSGLVQDMISFFYQLGGAPDDVRSYSMTITTGRRVVEYVVSFEGIEMLETPWGERSTRHLRVATPAKEDSSEIWLDDITRLPFKIRYRDRKGEIFDQIVTTVELEPTP